MLEFVSVKYKNVIEVDYLYIPKQRVTALTGNSGSGKTTLLKMMNKMISPCRGRILFEKTDLNEIDSVVHRRNVIMLSQSPIIFEGSIRDNLTIGLDFQKIGVPPDDYLYSVMKKVKLEKELDLSSSILSGGERQRLALARIMLLDPQVYLLDEPSSALDDDTGQIILGMFINHIRDNDKTMIMVTHSKEIAKNYSDYILEVDQGKIGNGSNNG